MVGVVVGALEYDGVVSGSVVVLARTHATRFRLPARPHYVPPLRKPPPLLRLANETHYDCTPYIIVHIIPAPLPSPPPRSLTVTHLDVGDGVQCGDGHGGGKRAELRLGRSATPCRTASQTSAPTSSATTSATARQTSTPTSSSSQLAQLLAKPAHHLLHTPPPSFSTPSSHHHCLQGWTGSGPLCRSCITLVRA